MLVAAIRTDGGNCFGFRLLGSFLSSGEDDYRRNLFGIPSATTFVEKSRSYVVMTCLTLGTFGTIRARF